MSNKNSYEAMLDHYCQYCAFKLDVCAKLDCKCPAYSMNVITARMIENSADIMMSPFKSHHSGFDV